MSTGVRQQLRRKVKSWLKQMRIRYVRARWGFDTDRFTEALRSVGCTPGSVAMVHSSWDAFIGYRGQISEMLDSLRSSVGPEGTLLFPTIPFTGSALDFVENHEIVDLSRTPSRMGMPSELFRRMPGVVRSAHPTHPVAAKGARAEEMTAGHPSCTTPCGRQSPFGALLDHDGKILLLGVTIESMTFFHTAEEVLEDRLPETPFTDRTWDLRVRDTHGTEHQVQTRLFDRDLSRRRRVSALEPILRDHGEWRATAIGPLNIVCLDARAVLRAVEAAIAQGVSLYAG